MKKILLLLTLTSVLWVTQLNAQCAYTYTQNGSTVTFNHLWPLALIYSLDSVRIDFGDGNSTLHVLPVPTSTTHTYTTQGTYNACLTRYLSQLGQPGVIICTYCDSITVGQTTNCNTSITTNVVGSNISAIATATGGTGPFVYTYTLNPGNITNATGLFTGLANGSYSVCATATDAQNTICSTDCDSVMVGNPPPPGGCTINASFSENITGLLVSFNNNTTISNGTMLNTAWAFGDGNTSTSSSPTHTYANAGTYNVVLVVTGIDSLQNPCIDSATKSIVVGPSAINAVNKGNLQIFPNPTQDAFTIAIPNHELLKELTITDVAGRRIPNNYQQISPNTISVSLKNQASGIYFIKLQTNQQIYTSTILKQE